MRSGRTPRRPPSCARRSPVPFEEAREGVAEAVRLLRVLESRFSRDTINIGVSGQARVGQEHAAADASPGWTTGRSRPARGCRSPPCAAGSSTAAPAAGHPAAAHVRHLRRRRARPAPRPAGPARACPPRPKRVRRAGSTRRARRRAGGRAEPAQLRHAAQAAARHAGALPTYQPDLVGGEREICRSTSCAPTSPTRPTTSSAGPGPGGPALPGGARPAHRVRLPARPGRAAGRGRPARPRRGRGGRRGAPRRRPAERGRRRAAGEARRWATGVLGRGRRARPGPAGHRPRLRRPSATSSSCVLNQGGIDAALATHAARRRPPRDQHGRAGPVLPGAGDRRGRRPRTCSPACSARCCEHLTERMPAMDAEVLAGTRAETLAAADRIERAGRRPGPDAGARCGPAPAAPPRTCDRAPGGCARTWPPGCRSWSARLHEQAREASEDPEFIDGRRAGLRGQPRMDHRRARRRRAGRGATRGCAGCGSTGSAPATPARSSTGSGWRSAAASSRSTASSPSASEQLWDAVADVLARHAGDAARARPTSARRPCASWPTCSTTPSHRARGCAGPCGRCSPIRLDYRSQLHPRVRSELDGLALRGGGPAYRRRATADRRRGARPGPSSCTGSCVRMAEQAAYLTKKALLRGGGHPGAGAARRGRAVRGHGDPLRATPSWSSAGSPTRTRTRSGRVSTRRSTRRTPGSPR